jgi:hypothetical protein
VFETAQANTDPNRLIPPTLPLTRRCATAQGEQALVGPFAKLLHHGRALRPHGHEHVWTKK